MGIEALSLDPADLPSFSRVGKNYSNGEGTQAIRRHTEREHNLRKRGRSDPSYVSLAETPPLVHGYNLDRGRQRAVCSSPRIQNDPNKDSGREDVGDGSRFQRVIRWDEVRGDNRGQHNSSSQQHASPDRRPGTKGLSRDTREPKLVVTHKQAREGEPYSSFVAVGREKTAFNLRAKHAGVAPPPGHYDATITLVRPRRNVLGYIKSSERPHAPTTQAGKLLSKSLDKSSTLLGKPLTPRSAFHLLRSKESEGAVALESSQARSEEKEPSKELAEHSVDAEEEDGLGATKGNMTGTLSKRGTGALDDSVMHMTLPATHVPSVEFDKMLPRLRNERSTMTGRFGDTAGCSPDVWYRSACERMEILDRHIHTPDLSRSGKDFDDQLSKLGYVKPETAAALPEYFSAKSHLDWTVKGGWYAMVKPQNNNVTVDIAKSLPRRMTRQARNGLGPTRACSRGEDVRMDTVEALVSPMQSVCPDERDPRFGHTSSLHMGRSSSSHQDIFNFKSPCNPKLPYKVSHRLLLSRSQSVIPFHKALARRPLTADKFSGKPVYEILDKVYEPERGITITRPRSMSPADMRRPGREAWGGHVGESSAGGLHGTTYWTNIGPRTEMQAGLAQKQLPSLDKTPGREQPVASDTSKERLAMSAALDQEVREPFSTAGKHYFLHGQASGALWDPKDNVQVRHLRTPNLDANQRAVDADRAASHPPVAHHLSYDYSLAPVKPRPRAALIHLNPMKQ